MIVNELIRKYDHIAYTEDDWSIIQDRDLVLSETDRWWLLHVCKPSELTVAVGSFRFHISAVRSCRGCSKPAPIAVQTLMALMSNRTEEPW